MINSGWTRGAGVPRCDPDTNEPEIFSTFGPKAIGMKGRSRQLPPQVFESGVVQVLKVGGTLARLGQEREGNGQTGTLEDDPPEARR